MILDDVEDDNEFLDEVLGKPLVEHPIADLHCSIEIPIVDNNILAILYV